MGSLYNGIEGNITLPGTVNISSSTNTAPIQVQTASAHGLTTGDAVCIQGHYVNYALNGTWVVTVIDTTHFSATGTTGVGVGAATGTVQPMGYGSTYTIPSDGDSRNAASVNVAFEALGDRSAVDAYSFGALKVFNVYNSLVDHGTSQSTVIYSHTYVSSVTWELVGEQAQILDHLQGGDVLSISATGQINVGDNSGNNSIALYTQFANSAGSPSWGSASRVLGYAQTWSAPSTGASFGYNLAGLVTVPSGMQSVQISLYALTSAAPGVGCTIAQQGDSAVTTTVYRPTLFGSRIA